MADAAAPRPRQGSPALPAGVRVVAATPALCEALAAALRPTDAAEAIAVHGDPATAIGDSVRDSIEAWVAVDAFGPICVWGVGNTTLLGGIGIPWCLTTARVELYARPFALVSRAWVSDMRQRYGFRALGNWVDPRHEQAVRWLRWLGFTVGPAMEHPAFGAPMRPFWMFC